MTVIALIDQPPDSSSASTFSPQRPAPQLLCDAPAFCHWLADAAPGSSLTYFRGHLAFDRMPSTSPFPEPERKRLVALANRALQMAEDGRVHLVQRRHGPQQYSYIAVKARRRLTGPVVPAGAMAGR
jgi:hypothetical protein